MSKPVHNTLAAERRKARHYGMQALYQWHMAGAVAERYRGGISRRLRFQPR